jgi:hypothetical protein
MGSYTSSVPVWHVTERPLHLSNLIVRKFAILLACIYKYKC